ncbi:MAG: Gfo/Idh/MocA family oxidoreductase [Balneolales bacterium]
MSKYDRREFLKISGLAGMGTGLISGCASDADYNPFPVKHNQKFNMHGYAAPALETVRLGIIGLGSRGTGTMKRFTRIEGVEIKALCDLIPEKVDSAVEWIKGSSSDNPASYSGNENEWKKLCERDDLDLIIINTPWHLHTPQAVYAMENGKHAGVEVPAAVTIEECWQLVETSERTRQHCMMLANPCYGDFQLTVLNMARQGFFGDIIHGEGAYIHDLLKTHLFNKNQYEAMWRLKQNIDRNGNLYPTHGLGTICQVMDINYGDNMDYLVSMSSKDFTMGETARELAETDPFFEPYIDANFRGNMNTSIIRTHNGRTIMLQHDVTSPRPGVRFDLISGTKGIAVARPERFATSHDGWLADDEYQNITEAHKPEILKRMGEMSKEVGGHGGIDALMTWRLIDCLRSGLALDMDVYDAALWSSISPLSEWSVANHSNSVEVPDFTSGAWKTNERGMDIEFQNGAGTTNII